MAGYWWLISPVPLSQNSPGCLSRFGDELPGSESVQKLRKGERGTFIGFEPMEGKQLLSTYVPVVPMGNYHYNMIRLFLRPHAKGLSVY